LCGCYTPRFESAAKVALTLLQPKIPESIHQLEHSLTPFPSSVFSKTFTKIILVLSDEFTYSWWVEILFPLETRHRCCAQRSTLCQEQQEQLNRQHCMYRRRK
jgi:hypothetical protein